MSNLYVPIDYSQLSEVIPEGEDILYSTLGFAQLISAMGGKIKWNTHILITKSGFAAFSRVEKYLTKKGKEKYNIIKKKKTIATFYPWHELKGSGLKTTPFTKKKVIVVLSKVNFIHYEAKIDKNFESSNSFNQRSKEFGTFCQKLWEERR